MAASLLLAAGLGALAAQAVWRALPLPASLSAARRFWAANQTTRLLNVPFFSADRELSAAALRLGRTLGPEEDVLLVLPRGAPPEAVEESRRRAAYLLAPRRVAVATGDVPAFRLSPVRGSP